MLKPTSDKDFKTDKYQDDPAKDTRFSRHLRPCFFADSNPQETDEEGKHADDRTGKICLPKLVRSDGKPNGERVDRGGDTLHQKGAQFEVGAADVFVLVLDAFNQHFDTDEK